MLPTRGLTIRLAAAVGLLAAAAASLGQSPAWVPRGPLGGSVYCLVADPSRPATLYAGTDQGVYKSADGGATWSAANAGISTYRVQTIAIDPRSPATLYVGTITPDGVPSVGIFKSTDAGATWTDANIGLIDTYTGVAPVDIESLAIDPRRPGTIWAGTRFSDIFQSTDGGATWQARTFGAVTIALETSAFRFDPSNPLTILAASNQGILRSTDGGATWNTYGNVNVSFFSLAADPGTPATLYAGNTSGSGIYKSTDGGAHWTASNKGLPVNQSSSGSFLPLVTAFAIDPSRPTTLYAATYGNGLFQSTDGAATWTPVGSAMRSSLVWTVLLAPGQSSTVYAGTVGAGVYQSLDSGRSFSNSNNGLDLALLYALLPDSASSSTLYAAAFDGVYKSTDAGQTWQTANNGVPVAPVVALARAGSPQVLFAATRGGGLIRSSDGGASWTPSAQGLTDAYLSSVTVDPSNGSILYAGTSHPYNGSNSERVYKSTDGGTTWSQTSLDAQGFSITSITVNPTKTSQVIAVSQGAAGYFQSLDSGKTWSTVATDANCGGVNAVFFDPSGATEYLAGTYGFCRSTDGAKTWTVSNVDFLASVQTLWIDPSSPSHLYAGAGPLVPGGTGGVFQSNDGGQTWQPVGSGLESASVTALFINPASKKFLAATHGNGIAELLAEQARQPIQTAPSGNRQTRKLTPH